LANPLGLLEEIGPSKLWGKSIIPIEGVGRLIQVTAISHNRPNPKYNPLSIQIAIL